MNTNETTKPKGKSKYAKKLARKLGRGRVDPRWMWWLDRAQTERTPPVFSSQAHATMQAEIAEDLARKAERAA